MRFFFGPKTHENKGTQPISQKMDTAPVTCPTCFEQFHVPLPYPDEVPSEVDYDCEICCRPMVVSFELEDDEVVAWARGIHE